jgi:hypothetical protein
MYNSALGSIALVQAQGAVCHRGLQESVQDSCISEQRGCLVRGRATTVHANMYDNDTGAMTSRALRRQFSG